jgi:3-oxoacyl-[acyl-carrier-protein] synthase-3
VSNSILTHTYATTYGPDWIRDWTGIEGRHFAEPGQGAADMALPAARAALEAAGIPASSLARILFTSSHGGDRPMPGTGSLLQGTLGADCDAIDVANGCQGFLSALDLGARCVAGGCSPLLVVAAEACGPYRDPRDRRSFPLFGDGAAAVVLDQDLSGSGGVLGSFHFNDGSLWQQLWVPGPRDAAALAEGPFVRFEAHGRVFRETVPRLLGRAVAGALAETGIDVASLDRVFPHQPNGAWMPELLALLGVRSDQVDLFVQGTGNVPTAMLPLGLDRAFRGPRPPRAGERWLLCSVGAGAAAGAILWRHA